MRFLTDINFSGVILRGLRRADPAIDIVRAQDVGLDGVDDQVLLEWAASEGRVLLTHDRRTIPDFAWQRVSAGDVMPGVLVIDRRLRIGQVIDDLLVVASCSEMGEWASRVEYLGP